MRTAILASDGVNHLLRNNKVVQIGLLHDLGKRFTHNGEHKLIKMVEFDFEGDGINDYFFFHDDKLEYHFVDPKREQFMLKIYKEAARPNGCDLSVFLNAVVGYYTAWKMGFIP